MLLHKDKLHYVQARSPLLVYSYKKTKLINSMFHDFLVSHLRTPNTRPIQTQGWSYHLHVWVCDCTYRL